MRKRAAGAVLLALGVALAGCNGKLRRAGEPRDDSAPPADDAYADDDSSGYDDSYADDSYDDDSGGYATEADRTAAMANRAAEAESQFQDDMANARTPEEKAAAYQKFEDARRDVNRMAEDEGGDDDDAYGPPP